MFEIIRRWLRRDDKERRGTEGPSNGPDPGQVKESASLNRQRQLPVDGKGRAGNHESRRGRRRQPPTYEFDALVAGLRGEIGAVQRRVTAEIQGRMKQDIELGEGNSERHDYYFYLEPDDENGEVRLPLLSLRSRRIPVLSEVELSLDAAVEDGGEDEHRYAFVFGPGIEYLDERRVRVTLRMSGLQPGPTEILVEGQLLKRIGASEDGADSRGKAAL